jgi:hypothetical protein
VNRIGRRTIFAMMLIVVDAVENRRHRHAEQIAAAFDCPLHSDNGGVS